jgi:hypothetical protein
VQDLETSLDSAVVRTGSSVAVAENAGVGRSVPAHLAQFAEAQRIIVLDAIRTDLLQPDAASESSHRTNGAMNGEGTSCHIRKTPQCLSRASALMQDMRSASTSGEMFPLKTISSSACMAARSMCSLYAGPLSGDR